MRVRLLCLCCLMLVLVMSSFVAHADTITYYVNDGVLSTDGTTNSGTFSGSFTFDLQNGNEPNEPGYISAEQFTVSLEHFHIRCIVISGETLRQTGDGEIVWRRSASQVAGGL